MRKAFIFFFITVPLLFGSMAYCEFDDPENLKVVLSGNNEWGGIVEIFISEDKLLRTTELKFSQCEIGLLLTQVQFRGRGHATLAMNTALGAMKDCEQIRLQAIPLDKSTKPTRLLRFYKKFGFEPSQADKIRTSLPTCVQLSLGYEPNKIWLYRNKPSDNLL